MSVSRSVPRQFRDDFNVVTSHYGMTAEEIGEAKEAALRDLDSAATAFADMAATIRAEAEADRRAKAASNFDYARAEAAAPDFDYIAKETAA
jgi:hypothetical protein